MNKVTFSLAILLTAVIFLVMGYYLGIRNSSLIPVVKRTTKQDTQKLKPTALNDRTVSFNWDPKISFEISGLDQVNYSIDKIAIYSGFADTENCSGILVKNFEQGSPSGDKCFGKDFLLKEGEEQKVVHMHMNMENESGKVQGTKAYIIYYKEKKSDGTYKVRKGFENPPWSAFSAEGHTKRDINLGFLIPKNTTEIYLAFGYFEDLYGHALSEDPMEQADGAFFINLQNQFAKQLSAREFLQIMTE